MQHKELYPIAIVIIYFVVIITNGADIKEVLPYIAAIIMAFIAYKIIPDNQVFSNQEKFKHGISLLADAANEHFESEDDYEEFKTDIFKIASKHRVFNNQEIELIFNVFE